MKDYTRIKESCRKHAELRRFIIQHFKKGGIGAEVGVLYGQLSEWILKDAQPIMLYLIDPWKKDDANGERTPEDMELMCQEVFYKHWDNSRVDIMRRESWEAFCIIDKAINSPDIWRFPYSSRLDFVYIDGDHDCIYEDLCGAWKIMKPGGVIAGDDWNCRYWGNKVELAVKKFCAEKNLKFEVYPIPSRPNLPAQFVIRVPEAI